MLCSEPLHSELPSFSDEGETCRSESAFRYHLLSASFEDKQKKLCKFAGENKKNMMNMSKISEKIRLFYVAMTRAKEKMIVGVLAQADKYAIDNNGTLVSSGGTAGYCLVSVPSDSPYSIYYIQAILGSMQGEWLASLYGEIFRGGYIARGTKVLKQIPVREIDFTNPDERNIHDDIVNRQKRLIELGDKISRVAKNRRSLIPLQRQFDLLKQEQQNVINMLYGMTNDEASLIPKIKEIYAAD